MPPLQQLLQSKWASAITGAILFLGITVALCLRAVPRLAQNARAAQAAVPVPTTPSWAFHNPELDQMIDQLKKEQENVRQKESRLNELELRISTERSELAKVMDEIKKMQQDLDQEILHVKEAEISNLKKLAKTYAAMEPASAVLILKELDDEALSKILVFNKESESAAILEALAKTGDAEAKRAAAISERLRLSTVRPATPKP